MKGLRAGRDWLYVPPGETKPIHVIDPLLYDKTKQEVVECLKSQPEDVLIRTCGRNLPVRELLTEITTETTIGKAFVMEVVSLRPNAS